jgi:hypothetical protein
MKFDTRQETSPEKKEAFVPWLIQNPQNPQKADLSGWFYFYVFPVFCD